MNTSLPQSPDPIQGLDRKVLLGLATEPTVVGQAPAYRIPDIAELNALFPDLEVIEILGSGGMGCVFKARQSKLDRFVAVKILPSDFAGDRSVAERFAREARAMARLNHPNIVSVHDFGSVGDLHYLIIEYMDGMNLREWLDASGMDSQMALGVFTQICGALAYAHEEGVIHRDIKPENILFNKQGHIALADFGLARLAMDSNCEISLTQTRQAMGTLNYMAPEQYEDPKTVDHRADIFAMGVLLYELLTGKVPRGSFPPPSSLCDVDATIDQVINTALQVNPDDRFQSVDEMAAAVCREPTLDRVGYGFAEQGTFTNLRQLAAAPLRIMEGLQAGDPAPVSGGRPAGEDVTPKQSIFPSLGLFSLITTVLVALLMLSPWSDRSPVWAIATTGLGDIPFVAILPLLGWLTWANYRVNEIPFWQWVILSVFVLSYCPGATMGMHPGHATPQRNIVIFLFGAMMFIHLVWAMVVVARRIRSRRRRQA
ncbi:MAG: serine/threonine-protein kinase [Planctomycetaceae bacterium]